MTPSNTSNAIAFAGKARRKQGPKPLQYPFHPSRLLMSFAAAIHRPRNCGSPSPSRPPSGSVIRRCFTTSAGYELSQKSWAESPPAQKLMAGCERAVCVAIRREIQS